jgi:hypothetical protein
MFKPLKNMLGEGITRETTINNSNITRDKIDYNNKNRTILTLIRYIYSL